ncbi:MAG: hypothetical protein AAF789_15350 [Bacteroidota bacterium]
MKRILLMLAAISVFAISCDEALLGLAFDYEYTFQTVVPGPSIANQAVSYETEPVANDLEDELAKRDLQILEEAKMKAVELSVGPEDGIDFGYLSYVRIYLVADGEEILIASREDMDPNEFAGKKQMELQLAGELEDYQDLLQYSELSVKFEYELREDFKDSFQLDIRVVAQILGKLGA